MYALDTWPKFWLGAFAPSWIVTPDDKLLDVRGDVHEVDLDRFVVASPLTGLVFVALMLDRLRRDRFLFVVRR